MNTGAKIAAFAAMLVVAFAAAVGIGRLVGPVDQTSSEPASAGHDTGHNESESGDAADAGSTEIPGGLMIAQDGYRLVLKDPRPAAGPRTSLSFVVLDPDGQPLTTYTEAHGKELHLIAVRRDLTGFQHVHPVRGDDGTWRVDIDTRIPGSYRVFADFVPAGRDSGLTLGADLLVGGAYDPVPFPATSRTDVVDGYTVALDGELTPGSDAKLTLAISRDGRPVTDLDPYLEAYGHLVALRDGDLAYLHVHPAGAPGDGKTTAGPEVTFYAAVPSAGQYRLFFDFSHGGVVRTADFTLSTTGSGPTGSGPTGSGPTGSRTAGAPDNNPSAAPSTPTADDHGEEGHGEEGSSDHG